MTLVRYTFATCAKCGVQSPPMIVNSITDVHNELVMQGWKMDPRKFTVIATCPKCQANEENQTGG